MQTFFQIEKMRHKYLLVISENKIFLDNRFPKKSFLDNSLKENLEMSLMELELKNIFCFNLISNIFI